MICKAGVACNVPTDIKPIVPKTLHNMRNIVTGIMKARGVDFYNFTRRQEKFSKYVTNVLGVMFNLYFEHFTIQVSL